jgi:hypothetical protein
MAREQIPTSNGRETESSYPQSNPTSLPSLDITTRYSFGTTGQEKREVGLELSNATSSICWIFVLLFDEAHNPKAILPATMKIPDARVLI